ncbi:T9SS type A sorting domain-containing protein [Flavivirga amylovorans]|uniref:T9SS type A sorting domain-containing protein n=1 Tax=Flavivirga amylovorans TaxID=870486 RepID=A0ABT8X707_9FLAO|nr:T9SS type A sorting domain-containing protein [Flavivirga amylovorans]MDO5989676.1 T9SS type A sorting domain-containing protein [Flavivirga amylovorans]
MKRNFTYKTFLTLSMIFYLIPLASAQIRFISVNPSNETITIKNFGASAVDISDYKLCIFPSYFKLNTLTISSGSLNLVAGGEVTVTSSTNLVDAGGELGLYIDTTDFGSSANIRDYIQWISTGGTRESVAVGAGIWITGTAIPNTVAVPYLYNGNGSTENGQSFWGSTLSVSDLAVNNFSMSPNPSSSTLSLKFPQVIDDGTLNIYNILGETIINKKLPLNNSLEIDVSNFNQGIYLVKINNQVKRFIKR